MCKKTSPISLFSLTKHRNSAPGINSHHFRRTSCRERKNVIQPCNKGMFTGLTDNFMPRVCFNNCHYEIVWKKKHHKPFLSWDIENKCINPISGRNTVKILYDKKYFCHLFITLRADIIYKPKDEVESYHHCIQLPSNYLFFTPLSIF